MLPYRMLSSQSNQSPSLFPSQTFKPANLQTCQRPFRTLLQGTGLSPLRTKSVTPSSHPSSTIPFRITSFADPHHLTPIESHLYKKQGRGGVSQPTQTVPQFSTDSKHPTNSNARSPIPFMRLLHGPLDTKNIPCRSRGCRYLATSLLLYLAFPPWNKRPSRTSSQVQR